MSRHFNLYIIPKLRILIAVISVVMSVVVVRADAKKFHIRGHIQESVGKTDLMKGYAVPIDADGNPGDTLRAGVLAMEGGFALMTDRSIFTFETVHKDSTYVFVVGCDGYLPQTVVYRVENLGKRERVREMPTTFLERAPHKLNEVVVTASKIKFYNRGDTIVYNADAFQLAEGSMLDGLIAQLPGVELSSNGQIKVNGEFVESLLLNGKQFFDGNNNLMLKNLAAYTVKSVEVYRGQSFSDKWKGDKSAPQRLTMDVKLKKEYEIGWLLNAQAGYGTEDRYMARLFGMWFNRTTQVMFLGNINNLNDTREPGTNDSWRPELMPTGRMKYQLAGLSYNYQANDRKTYSRGSVTYENNHMNSHTDTDRINFYADRNTYDYVQSLSHNKNVKVNLNNTTGRKWGNLTMNGTLKGNYSRIDRTAQSLSASYDSEQYERSLMSLEAIYSDGSDAGLASLINQTLTRSDGRSRQGNIDGSVYAGYMIPRSNDRLFTELRVVYDDKKETLWNDYDVRFGADGLQPLRRRNYTDNTPNHDLNLSGTLGYNLSNGGLNLSLRYIYNLHTREKDSYTYALDRLEEMGMYGTLPAGYGLVLDAPNSFTSSLIENTHAVRPELDYIWNGAEARQFSVTFKPELGLRYSHFNYFSDGILYPVRRTSFIGVVSSMNGRVRYAFGNRMARENMYVFMYDYELSTSTPDLLHLVDVSDTSDPLNIMLGNPGLKNSYRHNHNMSVRFFAGKCPLQDFLNFNYSPVTDALVRGYTYDLSTGVHRNRTYNVSGQYSAGVNNTFTLQFGRKRQFMLSSVSGVSMIHSVDMIGLNVSEPSRSTVNTRGLSEDLKLSWQIGRQSLSIKANVIDRHTSSAREGFNDINATHCNYGVASTFVLPAGFGISTDFTCYTRRGYGVKELDTTDVVWNARATYTPRGGRWVFTLDGFDLLHRLTNVHYAVTASGRTVTYTNTLPRYLLLSVQYRLNIQPKKR